MLVFELQNFKDVFYSIALCQQQSFNDEIGID
jgi:hypothetical protein